MGQVGIVGQGGRVGGAILREVNHLAARVRCFHLVVQPLVEGALAQDTDFFFDRGLGWDTTRPHNTRTVQLLHGTAYQLTVAKLTLFNALVRVRDLPLAVQPMTASVVHYDGNEFTPEHRAILKEL